MRPGDVAGLWAGTVAFVFGVVFVFGPRLTFAFNLVLISGDLVYLLRVMVMLLVIVACWQGLLCSAWSSPSASWSR